MKKIAKRRKTKGGYIPYLLVLPVLIGYFTFYLYPMVRGVYLSFTDSSLLKSGKFVGIHEYQRLFADATFRNAIRVTAQYVIINVGTQTVFALALAVAMDRLSKSVILRSTLLLPWLIPGVTVGLLWSWLLDPILGVVNVLLGHMGIHPQSFFGSETQAMPTIALVNTWRYVGYTSLLLFAGIQMIPKSLYEAAAIDGANEWKMFRKLTLPLLRPVLVLVMVISLVGAFQIFDTIAIVTKGGPIDATRAMNYYIFDQVFNRFHLGYGAAIATILLIFLAFISLVQLRLARADDSDLG